MQRKTMRGVRAGMALVVVTALGWLGGCLDDPGGPVPTDLPPEGVVVSNPIAAAAVTGGGPTTAAALAGDEVIYVSLFPGTVPNGQSATVRRVGDGVLLSTTLVDGGFDPVPLGAQVDDTVEVLVKDAGGAIVLQAMVAVRPSRPPVVVRTQPPNKKTDVPLNAAVVIVFSEPVDGSTLTPSSVRLLRGTTPIEGTVSLLQGSGTAAAFVPKVPLAPNAVYRAAVTRGVRDLGSDALQAEVTVDFTTGQSSTGPAASLDLSPDSVYLSGTTYQMTATVRDTAGNELIGLPIAWSTSDLSGLTVSSTGLLAAHAEGSYQVRATLGGLQAVASVFVSFAGSPALLEIWPHTDTIAPRETIGLTAAVRDSAGHGISNPSVTWTSSAPAVATITPLAGNQGTAVGVLTGVSLGSVTITATSGTARGTATITVAPSLVGSVTIIPASLTLAAEDGGWLRVALQDTSGDTLPASSICWRSDNPAVARIVYPASGGPIELCPGEQVWAVGFPENVQVMGVSEGAAVVTATKEGVSDSATITVTPRRTPVSVTVTPASATLLPGLRHRIDATALDAEGKPVSYRPRNWTSDNPAVATVTLDVNSWPWVTGLSPGSAVITATTEGLSGSATITVTDGWIAFSSDRKSNSPDYLDIYLASADGAGLFRLTDNLSFNFQAAWSPDGSRVAFTSDYDTNDSYWKIAVINVDGSGLERLTNGHLTTDTRPTWSPGGAKIAFSKHGEVYVMNPDGSSQTNLTNHPSSDYLPTWSPDGTKIAFVSERDGNAEIYLMNADGSGVTRLTNNAARDDGAVWSPDGTTLAFVSERDGNTEIYVMNADGSGLVNLTASRGSDAAPAWSPDGTKIAFVSERDGNAEIYVMNIDGSGLVNVTNNPATDDGAVWSPDGAKIAFQTDRDGNAEIYVMNADGSSLLNLSNSSGNDYAPAWRPR